VEELNPAVPAPLAELIAALLEKKPDRRPATAHAVIAALDGLHAPGDSTTRIVRAERSLPPRPCAAARSRRRWALLLAFPMLALLAGGAAVLVALGDPVRRGVTWPGPHERGVHLSELVPLRSENWFRSIPPPPIRGQLPAPDDGPPAPVRFRGQVWPHGLFMHAPPYSPEGQEPTRVTYRLGGHYRIFHAIVALNEGPDRSEAPMTFRVLGDGRELWRSSAVMSASWSAAAALNSRFAVPEPRKIGRPRRRAMISRRVRPFGASDQRPMRS
jgi:hypothetical protein